jgi:hypothetical protein
VGDIAVAHFLEFREIEAVDDVDLPQLQLYQLYHVPQPFDQYRDIATVRDSNNFIFHKSFVVNIAEGIDKKSRAIKDYLSLW